MISREDGLARGLEPPSVPVEPKPPAPRAVSSSVVDLLQLRRLVAHEHELGDAVAPAHLERLGAVGVQQQHAHLAAVARVDQARAR